MKKKSLLLVLIFSLLFGSVPINVFAETATYTVLTSGDCLNFAIDTWNVSVVGTDVRAVMLNKSGMQYFIGLVSETTFDYWVGKQGGACAVPSPGPDFYNGYYVKTVSGGYSNPTGTIPMLNIDGSKNVQNWSIYYTFGEGAVEPIEPINWGQLRDVNYSTKIAGSGQASMANEDTISWGITYDTFGNELTEDCEVEIRAVKGSWTASLKEDLLSFVGDTFGISQLVAPTLATVPASQGSFSIEWDEVCNALDISTYLAILAYQDTNNVYQKEGWIYEVRLKNSSDDYVGTWQRVYTATSASAQGSESLIIDSDMNININQALQEIAILNNQETVNININNTDYYVENPNNGTEPDGGTNLWDLLKALLSGIFQLLEKLGDIAVAIVQAVGDLLSGLLDLIHDLIFPPQEISTDINNDYQVNINNYLENDQPGLNTVHETVEDLQEAINDIADNHTGNPAATLTWDNVTVDLSPFNAGQVTFIQGGTYDFATAFMNLLQGFGMTYETYQMLVSGAIYISLLVLIGHKVKGFLAKT